MRNTNINQIKTFSKVNRKYVINTEWDVNVVSLALVDFQLFLPVLTNYDRTLISHEISSQISQWMQHQSFSQLRQADLP